MAVCRMRTRITTHRIRTRTSGRVSQTTKNKSNRRTTPGTCPQCRAEGNKPQQQQPIGWKAEKLNGRVEFGRSYRFEELRPKEGRH